MIGNLRRLGLSLLAALAMCAVTAVTASAEPFLFASEASHTSLAGETVGTETFTVDAGSATCSGTKYTGTADEELVGEVALAPTYKECTADPLGTAHVAMNGCYFVFFPVTAEGSNHEVEAAIECPGSNVAKVTVTALGVTKCTIDFGPQTGLKKVTVAETGSPGSIQATVELSGISYTQTAGTGLGACTNTSKSNGVYKATVVINGFNGETQVGLGLAQGGSVVRANPNVLDFEKEGKGAQRGFFIENVSNKKITVVTTVTGNDEKFKAADNCNSQPLEPKGQKGSVCKFVEVVTCEKEKVAGLAIVKSTEFGFDFVTLKEC